MCFRASVYEFYPIQSKSVDYYVHFISRGQTPWYPSMWAVWRFLPLRARYCCLYANFFFLSIGVSCIVDTFVFYGCEYDR